MAIMTTISNPPIIHYYIHVENQEGFYPPVQLLARMLASIRVNGLYVTHAQKHVHARPLCSLTSTVSSNKGSYYPPDKNMPPKKTSQKTKRITRGGAQGTKRPMPSTTPNPKWPRRTAATQVDEEEATNNRRHPNNRECSFTSPPNSASGRWCFFVPCSYISFLAVCPLSRVLIHSYMTGTGGQPQ